jgi:hypothetical protein
MKGRSAGRDAARAPGRGGDARTNWPQRNGCSPRGRGDQVVDVQVFTRCLTVFALGPGCRRWCSGDPGTRPGSSAGSLELRPALPAKSEGVQRYVRTARDTEERWGRPLYLWLFPHPLDAGLSVQRGGGDAERHGQRHDCSGYGSGACFQARDHEGPIAAVGLACTPVMDSQAYDVSRDGGRVSIAPWTGDPDGVPNGCGHLLIGQLLCSHRGTTACSHPRRGVRSLCYERR